MMGNKGRFLKKSTGRVPAMGRQLRYFYLRFIRLQGDPRSIARGFAIGAFVGVTPTIPLHTILALTLALLCRGSKIAALLGTVVVSNPLTLLPQYYLSWKIGNRLIDTGVSWEKISAKLAGIFSGGGFIDSLSTLGHLSMKTIAAMVLGGSILALPIAALAYVAAYKFFVAVRKKYEEKHALK